MDLLILGADGHGKVAKEAAGSRREIKRGATTCRK